MLFKFGKSGSSLCSFCNLKDETLYHLFFEYSYMSSLWNQPRHFLSNSLNILPPTPQSAIFGLINQKENFLIINHLLFIFKFHTYNNSRSCRKLNIEYLKTTIYKTWNIELKLSKTAKLRKQKYIEKWQPIHIHISLNSAKDGKVDFFSSLLITFIILISFNHILVSFFCLFLLIDCCCCCCFWFFINFVSVCRKTFVYHILFIHFSENNLW